MGGFESIFGGGSARAGRWTTGPGHPGERPLTLEEVARGAKRTVKLKTLERCSNCNGSGARKGSKPQPVPLCRGGRGAARGAQRVRPVRLGQPVSRLRRRGRDHQGGVRDLPRRRSRERRRSVTVEIPPGVSSNNYLTLRGQGPAGVRGGPAGDLIVMIEVKEDERFERQGDDLIHELPVSFSQAALGFEFRVPTATEETLVDIPPGTQSGTVIRLKGKGLPRLGQGGTGDLHVRVHVWTPDTLTDEQARIFRELAGHEGEPPSRSGGLWSKIKEVLGA